MPLNRKCNGPGKYSQDLLHHKTPGSHRQTQAVVVTDFLKSAIMFLFVLIIYANQTHCYDTYRFEYCCFYVLGQHLICIPDSDCHMQHCTLFLLLKGIYIDKES